MMGMFETDAEILEQDLDIARSRMDELRQQRDVLQETVDLLNKYGDVYEEFKNRVLGGRLEYLRLRKESLPYSSEQEHRHIDGQIAEIKWLQSCKSETLNELMRTRAAMEKQERQISKMQTKLQ